MTWILNILNLNKIIILTFKIFPVDSQYQSKKLKGIAFYKIRSVFRQFNDNKNAVSRPLIRD